MVLGELAHKGRDERRAPLKTLASEARVDYAREENVLTDVIFAAYFKLRGRDPHIDFICPLMQEHFFSVDLF